MKNFNIVVVSSSRADFDLLKNVIIGLKKAKTINHKFVVTGTHLREKFGKMFLRHCEKKA